MGLSAALWAALASGATAQIWPGLGSGDRISAGRLELSDDCPRHAQAASARSAARRAEIIAQALAAGLSQADAEAKAEADALSEVIVTGSAATFAPIVAGLVGDAAAAAASSAAAALEEASKARAFGLTGVSTFEFYTIGLSEGAVDLQPNFGPETKNACLILRSPGSSSATGDAPVYAELALHPVRDGFYVEPVFIQYAAALPGARSKGAMPAELHVEFSTPGAVADNVYSAKVFGLARIPLPDLAIGDTREGPTLGVQSELLPFRPEDGSIATARGLLTTSSLDQARRSDLVGARVRYLNLVRGRLDPYLVELDDEEISYPFECEIDSGDAEDDAECRRARAQLSQWETRAAGADEAAFKAALTAAEGAWLSAAIASATKPRVGEINGGSVTVRARFVLIQDENRFGTAIAASLKSRSAAMGAPRSRRWRAPISGVRLTARWFRPNIRSAAPPPP